MKNISKKFLLGTVLYGILMFGGCQEASAQQGNSYNYEGIKIYPITTQIANAIKNAPTQAAALDAICGQGGIVRGSGLNAGKTCLLQDFARLAHLSCAGYRKGKDSFADSKCAKNIDKVLGTQGKYTAPFFLEDAVEKNYPNTVTIVCDATPGYRDKLPNALKPIAEICPNPVGTDGFGHSSEKVVAPQRPLTPAPTMTTQYARLSEGELASGRLPVNPRPVTGIMQPPIQFDHMIQAALRDLPNRAEIEYLYESQMSLLDKIEALDKEIKRMEMQRAGKNNPARNKLLQQQAALINEYNQTNTELRKIKIQLEQKQQQPLRQDLLDAAKKQSEALKNLGQVLKKAGG